MDHTADSGKRSKLLDEVAEQVPAASLLQNLIDRLKGYVFLQLLLLARIAYTTTLGAADNSQQVEFVECASRFCEGEAEAFTHTPLRLTCYAKSAIIYALCVGRQSLMLSGQKSEGRFSRRPLVGHFVGAVSLE